MKKQAIEQIYTDRIREHLSEGWRAYTGAMSGGQGEMAHIDFTNGSEIRRVLMNRSFISRRDYAAHYYGFTGDRVTVTVGRNTDRLWPGRWDNTIWNSNLEVLSEIEFAEVQEPNWEHPDGWYTDMEEADRVEEVRNRRREAQRDPKPEERGEAYKSVALRWLKRQPRMKTAKLEDITKMVLSRRSDGRIAYTIEARGKEYTLQA